MFTEVRTQSGKEPRNHTVIENSVAHLQTAELLSNWKKCRLRSTEPTSCQSVAVSISCEASDTTASYKLNISASDVMAIGACLSVMCKNCCVWASRQNGDIGIKVSDPGLLKERNSSSTRRHYLVFFLRCGDRKCVTFLLQVYLTY